MNKTICCYVALVNQLVFPGLKIILFLTMCMLGVVVMYAYERRCPWRPEILNP